MSAAEISSPELIAKNGTQFERAEGVWTFTLSDFSTVSSDFTYKIILSSPTGKQYKTSLLYSSSSPLDPVVIKIKDPIKGPYFVYIQVMSATVNGNLTVIAKVSNHKNSTRYRSTYILNPVFHPINKKVFLGAFSVPH